MNTLSYSFIGSGFSQTNILVLNLHPELYLRSYWQSESLKIYSPLNFKSKYIIYSVLYKQMFYCYIINIIYRLFWYLAKKAPVKMGTILVKSVIDSAIILYWLKWD